MGLLDPDPLVRGTDPDPSIIKQNIKKNLKSYCFVTSLRLLIFEKLCYVPSKSNKQKTKEKIGTGTSTWLCKKGKQIGTSQVIICIKKERIGTSKPRLPV